MVESDYATPEDIVTARPDLSAETVRRCCRDGLIPGAVKLGRQWFIPAAAAEQYVETYKRYGRREQ